MPERKGSVCVCTCLVYMFVIYIPIAKEGQTAKHSVQNKVVKSSVKKEIHPLLTSTTGVNLTSECIFMLSDFLLEKDPCLLAMGDFCWEAKITLNYFIFNDLILEVPSKAVDSS